MAVKRIKINVELEVDVSFDSRWTKNPGLAVEHVQRQLDRTVRHLHPHVTYVGEVAKVEDHVS